MPTAADYIEFEIHVSRRGAPVHFFKARARVDGYADPRTDILTALRMIYCETNIPPADLNCVFDSEADVHRLAAHPTIDRIIRERAAVDRTYPYGPLGELFDTKVNSKDWLAREGYLCCRAMRRSAVEVWPGVTMNPQPRRH